MPDTLRHLKILLVEDSKTDAILIEKTLAKAAAGAYTVHKVEDITSALKILGEHAFDVVLLDLSLPDAFEFNGLLSIQNMAPALPVIILTAHADEDMALKAVEYGAQDYLFKDKANGNLIKRAMHYAIQRKQFEGGLIARANFDPLTGLAGRLLFESRLDMALARGKRTGDGVGILFLDLDHFKQVNDTMGHAAGDSVLQQVGTRLKQSVRPYDTVARFGGDEFALLIEGIKKPNDCSEVAQNIIKRIEEPLTIGGNPAKVGASIGIAVCFGGSMTREDVLQQADEAMYSAKQSSESAYRHHTKEIRGEALARNKMR